MTDRNGNILDSKQQNEDDIIHLLKNPDKISNVEDFLKWDWTSKCFTRSDTSKQSILHSKTARILILSDSNEKDLRILDQLSLRTPGLPDLVEVCISNETVTVEIPRA